MTAKFELPVILITDGPPPESKLDPGPQPLGEVVNDIEITPEVLAFWKTLRERYRDWHLARARQALGEPTDLEGLARIAIDAEDSRCLRLLWEIEIEDGGKFPIEWNAPEDIKALAQERPGRCWSQVRILPGYARVSVPRYRDWGKTREGRLGMMARAWEIQSGDHDYKDTRDFSPSGKNVDDPGYWLGGDRWHRSQS